jgi:diaminopimelate decarboxylase
MHPLHDEALWAAHAVKRGPEDSAVLFVSWNALDAQLNALASAWAHPNCNHAVAIKSQPHVEVLKHIVQRGFGLEAATWEEVRLARAAGCPPARIVFDSPVKRPHEIADCAAHSPGILLNANSIEELERIAPHAKRLTVGLRINPMVETDAPSVYHVSGDESKFGEPIANEDAIVHAVLQYPVEALHVHSGSSMRNFDGAVRALTRLRDLASRCNDALAGAGSDRRIHTLDVGGGLLPEHLVEGTAANMTAYASHLREVLPELWTDFAVVTEFGQWTHFHTGYALSDVEWVLQRGDRQVAYMHLGADFLLRDAYVKPRGIQWLPTRDGQVLDGDHVLTDLAGPLCFAGDYLEQGAQLPALKAGDQMLYLGTGSNAYALWSRHTSRTIPAVYGVDYALQTLTELSPRVNPFIPEGF